MGQCTFVLITFVLCDKAPQQNQLREEKFYWGSWFQVSPRPLQQEAWQWVSRHGTGVVAECLYLILKYGAERERQVGGIGF